MKGGIFKKKLFKSKRRFRVTEFLGCPQCNQTFIHKHFSIELFDCVRFSNTHNQALTTLTSTEADVLRAFANRSTNWQGRKCQTLISMRLFIIAIIGLENFCIVDHR